jgi:hypothetical protein
VNSAVARVWGRVLATVVAVLAIAFVQARRSGLTITELFAGAPTTVGGAIEAERVGGSPSGPEPTS